MAWVIRFLPWIAGAASIAGVLLWAQQSGVRLAVSAQNVQQLELLRRTIEAREEQRDREWLVAEEYFDASRKSSARADRLLIKVDALENSKCDSLSPDWVRLYNDSHD